MEQINLRQRKRITDICGICRHVCGERKAFGNRLAGWLFPHMPQDIPRTIWWGKFGEGSTGFGTRLRKCQNARRDKLQHLKPEHRTIIAASLDPRSWSMIHSLQTHKNHHRLWQNVNFIKRNYKLVCQSRVSSFESRVPVTTSQTPRAKFQAHTSLNEQKAERSIQSVL